MTPAPEPARPLIGGRFILDEDLADAAQPAIRLGRDALTNQRVVVRLTPMESLPSGHVERLRRDARTLRRAALPGLAPIRAVGDDGLSAWLVHDFIEGESLRRHLEHAPLPVVEALTLGQRLLATLDGLHQLGLVHRNVRPSNVIVPPSGLKDAVLVDFGTVRLARGTESVPLPVDELRYQSPEQAGLLRREVGARTDLYAAGAVLHEALSGRPPYEGRNAAHLLRALLDAPMPLRRLGAAVPRALEAVVQRLLRREPAERYRAAAAAAADLSALAVSMQAGERDPPLVIGRSDLRDTLTPPDLVGRRALQQELQQQLAVAGSGHSNLVRLLGAPGSGRSRLLDELRDAARAAGAQVIALPAAAEARPGLGLDTLAGALLARLQRDPMLAVRARLRIEADLPALRRRFAGFARAFPGPISPTAPKDELILGALLSALGDPARPALITQDDADRIDATTLAALAAWQRQRADRPSHTLVVLVAEDSEASRVALARLQGPLHALPPLSDRDVRRLAESMAGPLPATVHRRLAQMAEGSPAAARASLHALVESGALTHTDAGWRLAEGSGGEPVPKGVHALAEQALARLLPEAVVWLSAAAVIGQRFDLEAAAQVAGLSTAAAQDAADAAVRSHLVWREGARAAFVHAAVRRAVLETLTPVQSAHLNDKVANRLLASPSPAPDRLARHLAAAGRIEESAPFAMSGADLARGRSASLELVELLELAVRALAPDDPQRPHVVAELGATLVSVGRYDDAERWLRQSAEQAATPRERAAAQALQAELAFRRGDPLASLRLAESGLALLGRPVPRGRMTRARALLGAAARQVAHLASPSMFVGVRGPEHAATEGLAAELYRLMGQAAYLVEGPSSTSLVAHLRKLNLTERYPASEALAQAWGEHAMLLHELIGPTALTRRYADRSKAVAESLREPGLEGRALWFQGLIALEAAELEAAGEALTEALPLLKRQGDQWEADRALHALMRLEVARGNLTRALALADEMLERAKASQRTVDALIALEIRAVCLDGQLEDHHLRLARADPSDAFARLPGRIAEARILRGRGQLDRALVVAEDALVNAKRAGVKHTWAGRPLQLLHLELLREVYEAVSPYDRGRRHRLRQRLRRALRDAGRSLRGRALYASAVARERGLAAAMEGRPGDARRHLDEAVAVAHRTGLALDHMHALSAWGRVGRALGWPRADQVLDEALQHRQRLQPAAARASDPASTPSMADRFAAVVRLGRALASSLSINEVHRALREGTARVLRINRCLLFEVESGTIRGHDAPLSAVHEDTVAACVAAERSQVVDLPEGADGTPLSVLCVPVLARGAVVRVIYVEQRGLTGFFGRQEVRLTEFLATLAGAALENTAGFQAVRALSRSLEERTIELTQRNEELVTIKEELEAFSYSVAHDLRGGLVNIHGYGSALADDFAEQLDDLGQVYLERLRANALRLDRLTEALMMLSGIARTEMAPQRVDLTAMAEQIAADIAERRGDDIVWQIEPGLAAEVDPDLARIALHNLLDNAAKYARDADPPTVRFGRASEGGLEVVDNGVGFDPANADKLFRPFQRLHGSDFEGHGVGLVTVQRVVRRHGGQITATARPGEGARFVFTLPGDDPPASR